MFMLIEATQEVQNGIIFICYVAVMHCIWVFLRHDQ